MAGSPAIPAFSAQRHPNTVDSEGPYRVSVRQLAGPVISGGRVVYRVEGTRDTRGGEGEAELHRAPDGLAWSAEIPGQATNSTISYHFLLDTETGETVRHPNRASTQYRFQVVDSQVLAVSLPDPQGDAWGNPRVALRVEANSPPSGELMVHLLSVSAEDASEHRIPLELSDDTAHSNGSNIYVLEASLPSLQPGQIADLYFLLHPGAHDELRVPADAPDQVYTIKRPLLPVEVLPNDGAFVLAVQAEGERRWIGLNGGGAWAGSAEGDAIQWDLNDGLPSAVARFVLPDPVSGQAYIGTNRGVVMIDPGQQAWLALTPPYPWSAATDEDTVHDRASSQLAGPGVLSPLDGTLLFQLQAEQMLEEAIPQALFVQFRDGHLSLWDPPRQQPLLAGLSTASFDAVDGCWLLGGFASTPGGALSPLVVRRCGDTSEQILLQGFDVDGLEAMPSRVIAVARDPSNGDLVVGLEFTQAGDPPPRRDFGVFRLGEDGTMGALAPETLALGVEVTSLMTDWQRNRLLVGTFGEGLWVVEGGEASPLDSAEALPAEITALSVDENSGSVLVGTTQGAFELSGDRIAPLPFGPQGEGAVLTNAHPTDVDANSGRVLLSSYDQGLVELERDDSGQWHVVRSLRPAQELPDGLLGEAQFGPAGEVNAIMHSQGLLQIGDENTTLLGTDEGLRSPHLLRILTLESGDTWLAHTPMPFAAYGGPALEMLRHGSIVHTLEMADSSLATIGDWEEVPERGSIFAATRAGVVEIGTDGTWTRLSKNSVSTIARDAHSGALGVAGSAIERWDGERFVPVLFQVNHPRWTKGRFQPGSPIDLAIDRPGTWYLLFSNGILVQLDAQGRFAGIMDPEDGIPPTASRLLVHPASGDVLVGSNEGLVVVRHEEQR